MKFGQREGSYGVSTKCSPLTQKLSLQANRHFEANSHVSRCPLLQSARVTLSSIFNREMEDWDVPLLTGPMKRGSPVTISSIDTGFKQSAEVTHYISPSSRAISLTKLQGTDAASFLQQRAAYMGCVSAFIICFDFIEANLRNDKFNKFRFFKKACFSLVSTSQHCLSLPYPPSGSQR